MPPPPFLDSVLAIGGNTDTIGRYVSRSNSVRLWCARSPKHPLHVKQPRVNLLAAEAKERSVARREASACVAKRARTDKADLEPLNPARAGSRELALPRGVPRIANLVAYLQVKVDGTRPTPPRSSPLRR